ncbi:hypothetical protein U3A55_13480 [Salarchaeum sp. III]|uniref:DUF7344 domain-containing protein n=1 Tax=Salarchaeum sp. III TaxID=3107927 RepID=UPI002ED7BF65
MTGVLRNEGDDRGTEPTREDVFHLLSNQRRRHTLHYLRQRDGERVDLRELSRQLSAWENGVPTDEITHRDRKTVYTALRQTHLPKMDDADVVDYDPDRGHVKPAEEFEDVEVYLDVVPEKEIPRSEYYLGLSAFAAALLAVAWVDVFPFDSLSDVTWAAIIVALFVVSAAVDTYYDSHRQLGTDGAPPDLPTQE